MNNTIELKLREYAIKTLVDMPTLTQTADIASYVDTITRNIVLSLRAGVLADELLTEKRKLNFTFKTTSICYPTWWEHFKADVFPSWLKRKFPPRLNTTSQIHQRTRTIDFTKYATYPKARVSLPELGTPVYKYQILVNSDEADESGDEQWVEQ